MAEREHGPDRTEFAFERELAEVYLLLDYLSGRSDKSLAAALGKGNEKQGEEHLQKICQIDLSQKATADQRAMLLATKDRLNVAAKPANGASIAFTLLVTGSAPRDDGRGPSHWRLAFWRRSGDRRESRTPGDDSQGSHQPGHSAPPPGRHGGTEKSPPLAATIWNGKPYSRISLAETAYPGLDAKAGHFRRRIVQICGALVFWLVCTCLFSWNVAGGQASLARLNTVETTRTTVAKKIADAELAEIKTSGAAPSLAAASNVQDYCKRLLTANAAAPVDSKQAGNKQADSKQLEYVATQRQLCQEFTETDDNYTNARTQLRLWLVVWRSLFYWPGEQGNDIVEQQWGAVFLEVLGASVLPIFYGLLGAGVAVVRNIWSKLRDSLLTPRDLVLSLGQIAQGAVIGACIGLFFPSGSQSAGGLSTPITLAPSALSFIAGFGVEGVFVMVESLIKRVFNIAEQKP